MSFDEQPDGDPHGECAAEIARLTAELADSRAGYDAMNQRIYSSGGERFELNKARAALRAIAQMPDEQNEWDAVELYRQAREGAAQALAALPNVEPP